MPAPGSGCYVARGAKEMLRRAAMEKLSALSAMANELRLAGVSEEDIVAAVTAKNDTKEEGS